MARPRKRFVNQAGRVAPRPMPPSVGVPGDIQVPGPGPFPPEPPKVKPTFPKPPGPGPGPKQYDPSGIPEVPTDPPEGCLQVFDPTPYRLIEFEIEGGTSLQRDVVAKTVNQAFQWIYRAWAYTDMLVNTTWAGFDDWWYPQQFGWDRGKAAPSKDDFIAGSLREHFFGDYTPDKLKAVRDGYVFLGQLLTSKPPIKILAEPKFKPHKCGPAAFVRVQTRVYQPCPTFYQEEGSEEHVQIWQVKRLMEAMAPAAIEGFPLWTFINYAAARDMKFGRCKLSGSPLPCSPTPINISWYTHNSNTAADCSTWEKGRIEEVITKAFWIVDAAKRYVEGLAALSDEDRARMWSWQSYGIGTKEWRDRTKPALSDWFESYSASRFNRVYDIVTRLWNRYRYGTDKHDRLYFLCKSHKHCFEPFIQVDAWHSPTSVGKITLCKNFFDGKFDDVKTMIHETMHYLVGDSALTNDPHDLTHPACDGPGRDVCYDCDRVMDLLEIAPWKARENIDTYVCWMMQSYAVNRGCWPQQYLYRGEGAGEPELWVPPPPEFLP